MSFLSSTKRTARKDYKCAACECVIENGLEHFISNLKFSEKKTVVLARRDGWKVKAGTIYEDYRGVVDGTAYTLRMRPEMQDLVSKYDWWPEE